MSSDKVCTCCNDKKLGCAKHNWVQISFSDKDLSVSGKKKCKDCGYFGED